MKRRRYSKEQIFSILKEREAGMAAAEVCHRHGTNLAAYYN